MDITVFIALENCITYHKFITHLSYTVLFEIYWLFFYIYRVKSKA
jgi:hypothetical protein